ncbi:hypothetical protein GQ44DRAFT_758966 [Phaeosphaeriaceae sp. PMI808]|nr:hypothetical protein GQ44DRAFT_758966 [Phaeosphaeriaceae sp. PMI808]
MSMDVSSGRHTVAALLEGRMGMVYELHHGHIVEAEKRDTQSFNAIDVQANYQGIGLLGVDDHRTHDHNLINYSWNLNIHGPLQGHKFQGQSSKTACCRGIPMENGVTTFYRHICSEDDPPRSVSVCPQHRISNPNNRLTNCPKIIPSRPAWSNFWGPFGFQPGSHRLAGSRNCDHYHAVPLSDGHHMLITEPLNGRLALGCNAPFGGPIKMIQKIIFIPPTEDAIPNLYAAASDLSQGARIVVAYGETIMFYSIPPDVIIFSQTEQQEQNWLANKSSLLLNTNNWSDCQVWPLGIRGIKIGTLKGISELTVQTQPDLVIWAFTYSSQCKSWRLRNYVEPNVRMSQYVCLNGMVHDKSAIDDQNDVPIEDEPPASPLCTTFHLTVKGSEMEYPKTERSIILGADGNTSGVLKRMPQALAVEKDEWVGYVDVRGCSDAWYDGDGDVVMFYET